MTTVLLWASVAVAILAIVVVAVRWHRKNLNLTGGGV